MHFLQCVIVAACICLVHFDGVSSATIIRSESQKELLLLHGAMKNCVKESSWNCLKELSLEFLDMVKRVKVLPLFEGVRLVNLCHSENGRISTATVGDNRAFQPETWPEKISDKIAEVLKTHTFEMNFAEIANAYVRGMGAQKNVSEEVGTARGRRHRYNMIITMMFGVTALGAILIPMGFQMLSIVSGKALLLAKMALLLASINGLKRVANSGLHYGLYHVPGEHYGGYYDRGDVHHPRYASKVAIEQPIELGI